VRHSGELTHNTTWLQYASSGGGIESKRESGYI